MTTQSPEEPDLCIIGAGSAGFEAAIAGAALGLSVVVIERDTGDEIRRNGDLDWEVFRAAARTAWDAGIPPRFDTIQARSVRAAQAAAPDRRLVRLEAMNVRVIRADARFVDARTVTAGEHTLHPRRVILATGAVEDASDFGKLPEQAPRIGSLHDLATVPAHLLVLGQSARGLAMAQTMRRLGSAPTVVTGGDILAGFDPELAEPVRSALQREGVAILDRSGEVLAETEGGEIRLGLADGRSVAGSHILVADRRPALEALGLEAAGVATQGGSLVLSPSLRTTNPRVYAIGDVTGSASSAMAQAQLGVVLRAALFRLPARFRPELVPTILDTDPAIAIVGSSEAASRGLGRLAVHRWPFAETDAGRASGRSEGHVKVIADSRGRVLGAGIVGAEARELIAFWALAVANRSHLGDLAAIAMPRSSFADASRRALTGHVAGRLANPWIKRALALAARFG